MKKNSLRVTPSRNVIDPKLNHSFSISKKTYKTIKPSSSPSFINTSVDVRVVEKTRLIETDSNHLVKERGTKTYKLNIQPNVNFQVPFHALFIEETCDASSDNRNFVIADAFNFVKIN